MKVENFQKSLDELHCDLLVTTLFESERPPRGIAGLIDWRLNSFISKKIVDSVIHGKFGEHVLVPLHNRLPARRLLLLGLGTRREFNLAKARQLGLKIGEIVAKIGADDMAIFVPPADDERLVGATQRAVLDALGKSIIPDSVFVHSIDLAVLRDTELTFPVEKVGSSLKAANQ